MLAVRALTGHEPIGSAAQGNRKVVRAIESVAEWLGNTPAVARKSYVDPGVIDAYLDGGLVGKGSSEAAVLKLLRRRSRNSARPRG